MQKRLKSRKVAKDTVVTVKKGIRRKVLIAVPKDRLEGRKDIWPLMGMAVQSALNELGIKIDITIREGELAYEVIAEE